MGKFVFFTLNDFQKEGGGTIRMLGIMNELSKIHSDITLISNLKDVSKLDAKVKQISIGYEFSREDKRRFQFLLGTVGAKQLNNAFSEFLKVLKPIFSQFEDDTKFIFCEYLDNSIAYWLKENKLIKAYINDIHGVASNEFIFQAKNTSSLQSKILFKLKEKIANRVDKKVFNAADGIIYASEAMLNYFTNLYPSLKSKKNYHLPYLLNPENLKPTKNEVVDEWREKLNLNSKDYVFLFAGAFKETGGVQDLILAFSKVADRYTQAKLLLIGDGPAFHSCETLIKQQNNSNRIHLLGRQPYDYLTSFQELADVLVCPDRQNLFSELIVHVKYLDCLASGKIVINGSFKSVLEINQPKALSLLFQPSDVNDLAAKMEIAIENIEVLKLKYINSKDYTLENLTYSTFIENLVDER